ncbi:oxidoreductase [Halomonas sp. 18H]|uniref:molybdopterin-dependent oxidoreductase n=1 Tax=Halomonas almeriensis TaxID=308163 RepID=UPI002232A1E0|nr:MULTISPECIES: molybdopterin-dependent oxidoreductase [Halomonas]MCW4149650.1 oxidoreductase [Halomonas sp. 18H]MDN3553405.1 oxidoreductase [Halomonas almeriensis]
MVLGYLRWIGAAALLILLGVPFQTMAASEELPKPSGDVILTISGDIAHTNAGDEAHFDRAMLDRLAARTITTSTPWHDNAQRFEGPLFTALLDAVGADTEQVLVGALNGFEARIPVADFRRYEVILAMRCNGKQVPIRNLGPLLVMYPFDEHSELNTETVRFRSVWQVDRVFVY